MKREFSIKTKDEEIIFADLTSCENLELIAVSKNGNVFLIDSQTKENRKLSTLDFPTKYSEDLFKYSEITGDNKKFLQLHSYGNYVCIVQKYGQNGVVYNLENLEFNKQLNRGDYCVEHCTFPIAFFEKDNQTFLIHGTDWNRLDITNLETGKLLTDRIVDYDTDSNYFDYFHSSLLISPDSKHFTSNGWVWHPYDIITAYSIKEFLLTFEMSHTSIDFDDVDGYNWDRPLCWIDNKTIGIGYNKKEANDGKGDFPSEIVFVDMLENKIVNRIEFDGFDFSEYGAVIGELFFDSDAKQFIGLNNQTGLLISDLNGKEIYKDSNLTSHKYSQNHKFFYQVDYENQLVQIEKPSNF